MTSQYHIHNCKSNFTELALIRKIIRDTEKTYYLMNSLGDEYGSFKIVTLKPPIPSYHFVIPQHITFDLRNGLTVEKSNTELFDMDKKKGKFYKKIQRRG